DCMNGMIDVVMTKSISRFSRNLLDTLTYVRMLKDQGITIIFDSSVIIGLNQKPLQTGGDLVLFSFISEQFHTNGGVIVRAAASGEHPLT
ncbi:MAG: recombinase family protein, partial [Oscillospiraceae bacterium]|nr:recombinase family protein [Oscillospiraceae bacterium]